MINTIHFKIQLLILVESLQLIAAEEAKEAMPAEINGSVHNTKNAKTLSKVLAFLKYGINLTMETAGVEPASRNSAT